MGWSKQGASCWSGSSIGGLFKEDGKAEVTMGYSWDSVGERRIGRGIFLVPARVKGLDYLNVKGELRWSTVIV